jgi:tRNA threonylcarbamoyladenosine biosynthesis protein TsaB
MKVLAIDTTSERESVAVTDGPTLLGEVRLRAGVVPSRRILPAAAYLLDAAGISAKDIEGYAVAVGPGSFTGIRVGLSTVQGLALAAGRPCLGLSTLDILAALARGEASTIVPMIDASRSGHVFAAIYDAEGRTSEAPQAVLPEAVAGRVTGTAVFLGDGADRYRAEILARRKDALFRPRSLYLAAVLARLAEPRLAAGEGIPPGDLRPLYLRPADIRPGPR